MKHDGAADTINVKFNPAATAGRVETNSVASLKKKTLPDSAAVITFVVVTTSVRLR